MTIETLEQPLAYQCEERPRSLVEHYWEHQLTDLGGKPTGPLHVKKGNSWVRNMAVQMRARLSDSPTNGVLTSGSVQTMRVGITPTRAWSLQLVALPAGVGISGRGILLGSGAAPAENTNDFNLAAL